MSSNKTSQRRDPFPNHRFIVEIDGIAQAGFCEVIFPDSTSQVIEYKEGVDLINVRKQPGPTINSNLILKWGLTISMELYNWRKLVEQGKTNIMRRNIAVTLLDEAGNEAAKWTFVNAWPMRYKGPDLNSNGKEVAIETLEIVFESMQRIK